ncbi:MAG: choice-of-anchor J domain-containing protein [Bacteroidales bacterium]|jgi:hypothetical protein
MKKIITIMAFMALFTGLKAQIVFQENFDAVTPDSLPAGWTKFNLDGFTANSSLVTTATPWDKAWGCYAMTSCQITSECAWSTSWFTSPGTANRWMFTPAITVPATHPVLQYTVCAQDPSYPDGYELHIMTTAPTAATITSSTVLLTSNPAPSTPTLVNIDLTSYAGQTVYFGWRNIATDMFTLAVDNVVVKSLAGIDATLTSINTADYVVAGNTNITGTVTNSGANNITSFDVKYTITGTTSLTSTVFSVTGVNIATMGTYNFTHNVPAALTVGQDSVHVTISNVNGGTDANPADNLLAKQITVISSVPTKRVFCEEETGTWCGWCIRGIVYMGQVATAHPTDWVGIAVHDSDPMTVTAWDAGTTTFPGFSGFPSIEVDRTILDDPSNAAAVYTTQKAVVSPVDVALANVSYTSSTRQISFDVKAKPVTTGTVNWRINGAIFEMNVNWQEDASPAADSANYQQHNYYSGGGYGVMGGFELLSDPVPAADMHFDFVSRALLGGYDGTASSIPASIVDGTTYTQNYTYTVPAYQNEAQMYVVGFVVDQASGKVLNSIQSVIPAGVHETQSNSFKMFPNPTKGIVNFIGLNANSQITVTNLYGETLMFVENVKSINLSNFANGVYFVNIKSDNSTVTEKIILNK